MDVKPGQFIKLFAWCGYVRDIYKSGSQSVAEIVFAKDVTRSNPPELHRLDFADLIVVSTADEFMAEIAAIRQGQDEAVRNVLFEASVYGKEQPKC